MRFRWSSYYEDLQHERSQQHSEPSTSTSSPPAAEIPYLVYPSYSGDIPALDYHAARAASAASTQQDIDRIARDEANYAAQQTRNHRALSEQHHSTSFATHDLLPQLHGPPLPHSPNTLSLRQQEAAARTRAANVVRLGSGITPAGWAPPPPSSPRHGLSSFSFFPVSDTAPQKPSKPIGASMAQRMAALGSVYSLGIVALDDQEGQLRQFARAERVAAATNDHWALTSSAFSSWFPPPYRVLSLVALGILVFAADIAILNRLGIDPVPLLFPNRRPTTTTTAGSRGRAASSLPLRRARSRQGIGLGAALTTPTQLTRALLLLGTVYAALALAGWASFRTYVDASWLHGDPSGRHAQALQGLAVGAALGLACWPGKFLLRELRWAFWSGLGRLLWPSSEVVGVPIVGARVASSRNGGAAGEDERPMSAAEMARFQGEDQDEDEDEDEEEDDARELLTTTTAPSRPSSPSLSNKLRLALHKLRLALRDTRRWSLPTPFSAVILADVLTSFAKVFADVWLTACFLVPRKEHHTWWNGRGSVVVPILTSLPYLIRLRQCISEYVSTSPSRKHNQHQHQHSQHRPRSRRPLFNALKYFSALPVIWLAALEGFASSELAAWEAEMGAEGRVDVLGGGGIGVQGVGVGKGIQVVKGDMWAWGEEARWRQRMIWRSWLFWVFFNSIFSFWWDVTYDWGLDIFRLRTVSRIISSSPEPSPTTHAHPHTHTHRRALSSVVLRPPQTPLLFPEWAYHLTIVLDLILRFTWSIKLSSQLFRYADWEGGVFLLEAGEIVRRGAWVVLRFEHAALGAWGAGLLAGGRGGGTTTNQPFTTRVGVGMGVEDGGGYVDEDGGEDDVGAEDGKAKVRWAV
ncbi:hypothetical protein A4X06_0g7232 [Tilletia controversa]|uniref:EXS domain-containing protein n=1 Tax=Tilletia controversa TaxID=13291 RepID=A0A8X7MN67_9BASI|nr:hypothetical protein CF328_g6406 [Tilletia controversa]KAE8242108.1 hypothetical protein A4X06_0g7232 [Tilletia controversa]